MGEQKKEQNKDLVLLDDEKEKEKVWIAEQFENNKESVIQMLLEQVKNVRLEVGRAVRDDYDDLDL